jgi:hypothetical protein
MARGSAWSPATHQHWPDAFKTAARTLLLVASHIQSSGEDLGPAGKALQPSILARCLAVMSKAGTRGPLANRGRSASHSNGDGWGTARKAARHLPSPTACQRCLPRCCCASSSWRRRPCLIGCERCSSRLRVFRVCNCSATL